VRNSYWNNILQTRLGRRRALAGTGAATAGALLLAACGGGSTTDGEGGKTSLLSQPVDTSKQAKRGGTMKWFAPSEPAHFDTNIGLSPLNTPNNLITSLLVNEKPGVLKPPEYSDVVPDLAESWEWSPDRLQLTMKIRDGVKWHNKAPVGGRAFETEDIIASWNRFAAKSQGRGNLANSANPNAPVLSVTAADRRTVVFKLKDPIVYFLSQLTPGQTGSFQMLPKEADSTFDVRKDLIGTGPFILTNYVPSQGMTFTRNPDYWDKSVGYVDQVNYPGIPEYAQQLAQLKAGNVFTLFGTTGSGMRQEDILVMKRDMPDLKIYAIQPYGFNPGVALQFGTQPTEANKAFKDERVRQAFSMAHDRDTYIDVFNNVSKFQAEGLPVQSYWFTSLGAAPGWRIDPKDAKVFGDGAKYFKYDIAEAKKLLASAGYPNGLDVISSYIKGTELNTNGRDYHKQVEVRQDMLRAIGVRPTVNLIDYTTEYLPKYITNAGKFDGIVYRVGVASSNDPVVWSEWRYKSGSGDGWIGFDSAGKGDGSGDPQVETLIGKARQEPDIEKRKQLISDLQKYLGKTMYAISEPGSADTFDLAWPALQNHRVFNGDRRGHAVTWWIDESLPPFKKT
jgi:peptide/nickel transport system substrate-binding protein